MEKTPLPNTKKEIFVGILTCAVLGAFVWVVFFWRPKIDWRLPQFEFSLAKKEEQVISSEPDFVKRQKSEQKIVKGLYLTANSAASEKKTDEVISLIEKTELNAVVIDIKDYTGNILYNSSLSAVNELGTKRAVIKDLSSVIKKFHDHNIYVIARQTVFQDPVLAKAKTEWAIKAKSGGVWHDQKGIAWVDPSQREVWKYNVEIAREAADFGFDEINFDYVRFPTDGNMKNALVPSSSAKNDIMKDFYNYISESLKDEPVYISVDFFGLIMEVRDGMNIGQKLDSANDAVDYICPMMYPSHYAAGQLGFKNPAEHPFEIIDHGMKSGENFFVGHRAVVRPWLQAFNIGAKYDGPKIRAQIDAVEKYPNAGWLLWNAANRYTSDGLKAE